VFKFRSVNSIVIAAANTGRDASNKNIVTRTDQTNNGIWWALNALCRILYAVTMKLILPKIDLTPAR